MKRIRELDGLRCLAILGVLCVHYRPAYRPVFYPMSLGWAGVDLFFVLSGFLITTNLVSLRGSLHPYRNFYWRRLLRIVPPYYLVFCSLFALQSLHHISFSFTRNVVPTLLFLTAFMGLDPIHHLFSVLTQHAPLYTQRALVDNHVLERFTLGTGVSWSLSFEEIFYLGWAPIVLRSSRRTLILITCLVIAFSPLLRLLGHVAQNQEAFFFPFRFDELAMGSLLALVFVAHGRDEIDARKLHRVLVAMALPAIIALILLSVESGVLDQMEIRSALSFAAFGYSLLGLFFTSMVGLAVLHQNGKGWWLRCLRARPLVYIGTISYMMYLIHVPVYGVMYTFQGRFRGQHYLPGIGFAALCAAITVGLSALSWRIFESPLLRFKNVAFFAKKVPVVSA